MRKVSQLLLAISFMAISCSDETTVFKDNLQDDVSLEENEAVLQASINFDNVGVLDIFEKNQITGKSAKNGADVPVGDYPLTLIAQVDAPSYEGFRNLGATHVSIDGNYAYVSYNTVSEDYAGAIDIVDITDPNAPKISSRLYFFNADLNSVTFDNGFVYGVGGFDSEKLPNIDSNSFIAKIPVSGGRFVTRDITYGFQIGFNATDVAITGNKVLVTSGKDGMVKAYNKSDLTDMTEAPYADLRAIAIDDNKIAVLDASSGVKLLDENLNTTKDIAIDSDFGSFSKRTLDFFGDNILVAEGSNGAGVYNMASGSFIEYIPILLDPENVEDSNVVTNAVAVNDNLVLMANGGAGLSLSEGSGVSADPYGVIQLSSSINYVASKGDYIFAASGLVGLQVIKLNRPVKDLTVLCQDSKEYNGSSSLNAAIGDDLAYNSGANGKRLTSVTISGEALLCGSWSSKGGIVVNDNGILSLNGTFSVGANVSGNPPALDIAKDGKLAVEGQLVIYGDLVLGEGAILEAVGNGSITLFGFVTKDPTAKIIGTFNKI